MDQEDLINCSLDDEGEDEGGFKAPLPVNPEAVSDDSSEGSEPEELELKRPRFDSESSDISTASSSCYSVGSNISNFSNFSQLSMMSNVSTLSDGGIFKKPEEKKDLPDAKTKMT